MPKIPEPCLCGADDCPRCYPEIRRQMKRRRRMLSEREIEDGDYEPPEPDDPVGIMADKHDRYWLRLEMGEA